MKKLVIIGIIIALSIGVYIIFTLKSGQELDESSPLGAMDEATKQEFMEQVEAMKETVMEKTEAMPQEATLLAKGDFVRRFHSVEGLALLIETENNPVLRFEDFRTDNGPQLHIYLATSLDAKDFIDLGPIKATKGNVNYTIPAGIDTGKYRYVLVWCKPFGVLFSYAELISV